MSASGVAPSTLEQRIEAQVYGLGFDLCGFATLGPMETAPHFEEWLDAGYAGEMLYLPKWRDKRADTRLPFEGVSSAIVVAMNYGGREPSGPVARYARGDDYHDVMVERLRELHAWVESEVRRPVRGKAYVDTGPILERDLARRAGLGWFGKNTNLINPKLGSFFFIGSLFLDLELAPSAPFEAEHCGTCTRCLDACPTDAFTAPRQLDATKCISYLTIEARGEIPVELRAGVGDRLYGCDVCQEVCPWNVRFARALPDDSPYRPREALAGKDARALAREILAMSDDDFRASFKGSPMKRAKLRGLERNAAVVLANLGTADDVPSLVAAASDPESLVRGHAAWALGRIGSPEALAALRARASVEADGWVLEELSRQCPGQKGHSAPADVVLADLAADSERSADG